MHAPVNFALDPAPSHPGHPASRIDVPSERHALRQRSLLRCCFATCHARPQDMGCNIVIPRSGGAVGPSSRSFQGHLCDGLATRPRFSTDKANGLRLTWILLAILRHVPETQRKSTGRHVAQFQQRACVVEANRPPTRCSQLPCDPFVSLERYICVEADQSRCDQFTGAHQDWQILEQQNRTKPSEWLLRQQGSFSRTCRSMV